MLILAEACNPQWTSVPLEGWSHYAALARISDAHLVTQVRNADAIRATGLIEGRDFTAIDTENVAGRIDRLGDRLRGGKGRGWTTKMALMLFRQGHFEKQVWKQFGERIASKQFDLVHQLTPLSPTIPPKIATWCKRAGVPFVWGPINGGLPWPNGYTQAVMQEREWLSYLRGLYRFAPGYRSSRRDAAAILIGSRATWDQMPARYRDKCFYVSENAIDPTRFTRRRERRAEVPIRCAFVGRLVPYKGGLMLLEAASDLLRAGKLTIDFVGDGPQEQDLRGFVSTHQLAGVTFHGKVPHERVQDVLASADLLTFPSIREFGGAVAAEAMAVGVVPVVPAYGGLGEIVTDDTGFRLPIGPPQQLIRDLRTLLSGLVEHPAAIDARSEPARRRANELFTWDAKARTVEQVWNWLLKRSEKPSLPPPSV
ncbi:MAG: glycosyltransferase [Tepidisphaeraceae bacterium]